MSFSRCPHCNVPLTHDEAAASVCGACRKSLRGGASAIPESAVIVDRPDRPTYAPEPARAPRAAKPGRVLSILALLLALFAVFLAAFRDPFGPIYRLRLNPFGSALAGYDFRTAGAAYKSELQIEQRRDLPAIMELTRLLDDPELKEKINTLEVAKEAEVRLPDRKAGRKTPKERDIKVLFITYKLDGEPRYQVQTMERHASSGVWKKTFVDWGQVQDKNKALAKEMREWEQKDLKKGGDERGGE